MRFRSCNHVKEDVGEVSSRVDWPNYRHHDGVLYNLARCQVVTWESLNFLGGGSHFYVNGCPFLRQELYFDYESIGDFISSRQIENCWLIELTQGVAVQVYASVTVGITWSKVLYCTREEEFPSFFFSSNGGRNATRRVGVEWEQYPYDSAIAVADPKLKDHPDYVLKEWHKFLMTQPGFNCRHPYFKFMHVNMPKTIAQLEYRKKKCRGYDSV